MQLLCDQEHTYGAALRPAAGMGSGSRGRGDPAAVGGTAVLHRMVHYTWDRIREVGCECAHVLVSGCGCACVRARDSVCYNIRFSLSPILQLLVLGQALGFALWKTCYTISYWLAVINRDRQHASSIPINCENAIPKATPAMIPIFVSIKLVTKS